MTTMDWATLGIACITVALALLVEHYLERPLRLKPQFNYALGLLTDMGGILLWAALRRMTVTFEVALAMLLAACLAGVPDALLHFMEQAEERRRYALIEGANRDLADKVHAYENRLRVFERKHVTSRYWSRLRQMVETAAFATAAALREQELAEEARRQQMDILQEIRELLGVPEEEEKEKPGPG